MKKKILLPVVAFAVLALGGAPAINHAVVQPVHAQTTQVQQLKTQDLTAEQETVEKKDSSVESTAEKDAPGGHADQGQQADHQFEGTE